MTSPFFQYLPVEEDALKWGLHVLGAGNESIPPLSPYPPHKHPEGYEFSWEDGRVLNEYQLVYITHGRGVFESRETGKVQITRGQAFLLFPGVWHRYRPLKTVGWDENWVGFGGDIADRIMQGFFTPKKAVLSIGYDEELVTLIRSIGALTQESLAGVQQIMATRTTSALALVRSRALSYHATDREAARKVQQARYHFLAHSGEEVDMEGLAKQLGLSYSRFRSLFREHTGTAPHQYLLNIRINRARELLRHTDLPISEIAERTGFASAYYFSRLFKNKTGKTPSSLRKATG